MDRLRRIIIHKSENGYMFSIKDLGHPYSEAAPVNKVASNGPADCAGLRSGDGVVAINSNLVKGKSYTDLCNIIKSCRGTSLELTVIESYYLSTVPQNKSQDERHVTSNHSTPLSYDESSALKYSPILIKKKAYTYDNQILETFSMLSTDDPTSSNSVNEMFLDNSENDFNNEDPCPPASGRYITARPKISYKRATNTVYKTAAKSDLDINNSASGRPLNTKGAQFDPQSKVVYHQAYKQLSVSAASTGKSGPDSQQTDQPSRHRRGSTPVISDSSSLTTIRGGQYSQPKTNAHDRSRKTSRNLLKCKPGGSQATMSPVLHLNRVGGLVRAPLSIDETIDLDQEPDCQEDLDAMVTDHSSATAATTESGRSSCDLDPLVDAGVPKSKFRHMHFSPMPYKSHSVSGHASLPSEIIPSSEPLQIPKYESPRLKESLLSIPLTKSSPRSDTNSLIDIQEPSYQQQTQSYHEGLIDDMVQDKDSSDLGEEFAMNYNFRHVKKIKNIFGENYRCRSKTLDSDGKLEDDDINAKVTPVSVLVKWITYEGKACKNSWKQYMIHIDDDHLILCREKSQYNHKSTSLEDVTMSVNLPNVIVEDEPEKRSRRNTLRLIQADRQIECLIEFSEKSLAINWLRIILDRSKADRDDRGSRNTSFKERHSLTVPNLFGNQSQFSKTKSKSKDGTASPIQTAMAAAPLSTATSGKSVLHQAMSRVKNLKHKFASSGQVSDFERQQEEWHNKTSSNQPGKLVTSSSYNEDIQGGLEGISGTCQTTAWDSKAQILFSEIVAANMLPLHKWQRSNVSHLIPLVVELCVSIIETFGMNLVGLYRVSGNKVALDFITAELHKPISEIDITTDKWNDLHAISGVLKSFFRNLPDGLFPKDLYSDIIGACRMHEFDRERRLLSIQRFLSIMDIAQDHPEYRYHRETLRYLAEHLSRVASRHSINKMNAKNLAVIFAPSLIIPPQETNQMLVNDYKYKIQLIETLIKYHKWLFSPTLESACNIPIDSDDEDCLKNTLSSEDIPVDQLEVVDSSPQEMTDARPLVKKVLSRATKISNESPENTDKISSHFVEYGNESHLTLAELSRQAYAFNSMGGGYKEVDIDEECERRKIKVETNVIEQLKSETEKILSECSKDIEELNGIQYKCQQNLSDVQLKIKEVDDEIVKTELFLENTKNKTVLSRSVASQLFDIPTRNLSSLSVAIASPAYSPQLPVSESHKS